MIHYDLKEYTEEEYAADMKKLLADKGLYDAVKVYCDEIDSITSCCSYLTHRHIQECLCDILYLIENR